MILDPRLVPWAEVLPGVGLSALVAAFGLISVRWKSWPAIALLSVAPVLGWALIIYHLKDFLPGIPPSDATLWSFYFAIVGGLVAIAAPAWARGLPGVFVMGAILAAACVAALWYALFGSLHESFAEAHPSSAWLTLALCATAVLGAAVFPVKNTGWVSLAPGYAPWICGLFTAAICLTLTRTAMVGIYALSLAFATIPPALAVLFIRKPGLAIVARPWLGPALTLPPLMVSGPLFASTPWPVAATVVAGVLCGMVAVVVANLWLFPKFPMLQERRTAKALAGIIIGIVFTFLPVAWPIFNLLAEAAKSDFPY